MIAGLRNGFPSSPPHGGGVAAPSRKSCEATAAGADGEAVKKLESSAIPLLAVVPCYVPHLLLDTGALKTTGGKAEVPSLHKEGTSPFPQVVPDARVQRTTCG